MASAVLKHHGPILDRVDIYKVVAAAQYDYPYHHGFIQAIAERYIRETNTIATAEGEMAIDLWAVHHISSLPIVGKPYEGVMDEFHRSTTNGAGRYITPYCYHYLLKVWRDLSKTKRASISSGEGSSSDPGKVSLAAWARFFFGGPFRYR